MPRIRLSSTHHQASALSRRNTPTRMPLGCAALFGLLFILPGLAIAFYLGVRPLLQVLAAQHWTPTPATVLASEVLIHSDSDGETYSIHIEYRYAWIETTHTSTRYDFSSGSSSGRANKDRIVARHPVGSTLEVWVNPKNPAEAVIDRSPKPFYFGMVAFGLVFVTAGSAVVFGSLRARDRIVAGLDSLSAGTASTPHCLPAPPATDAAGTLVLKPSSGPWMKVLGTLLITLFWNGILSVFIYQLSESFQRGRPEWFLALFLIPFVLVGLLIIAGFFHALLATANPRVLLLIGPGNPRCGGRFTLDWEFLGSTHRLQNFRLLLEGVEKATYRHGTNTRTDEHVFHRHTLARREAGQPMENGTVALEFPADTPPSFRASNNRIEWRLVVQGDIPHWPDLSETYPLVVLPPEIARA